MDYNTEYYLACIANIVNKNPNEFKVELFKKAFDVVFGFSQSDSTFCYDVIKSGISYAEICEACNWPDFQDCGIFEQQINLAVAAVLDICGFPRDAIKPLTH